MTKELYHYGMPRRSGRYPWGSGQRPYQDDEGKYFKTKDTVMTKEEAVKRGSASDVAKYFNDLDKSELQEALTRLNMEARISDISKKEMVTMMDKIKSASDKLATAGAALGGTIAVYNNIVGIYNATPQGRRDPLPFIRRG